MLDDIADHPFKAIITAAFVIFGGALILSHAKDKKERALIASGDCAAKTEALYTPPPTMVCTSYNSDGSCTVFVPVQPDPYMQTLWVCKDNSQFWRKSE